MIPASILSEGRALLPTFPVRAMVCAVSALRAIVCHAIMTTPGGAGTPRKAHLQLFHVLGAPISLIGSELSSLLGSDPSLRSYPAIIDSPLLGKRAKGRSLTARLRPFAANRNVCHFLWYGGSAGEGLRSVGADGELPIQEHVLYPAPRPPFTGRGSLQCVNPGPRLAAIASGRSIGTALTQ